MQYIDQTFIAFVKIQFTNKLEWWNNSISTGWTAAEVAVDSTDAAVDSADAAEVAVA